VALQAKARAARLDACKRKGSFHVGSRSEVSIRQFGTKVVENHDEHRPDGTPNHWSNKWSQPGRYLFLWGQVLVIRHPPVIRKAFWSTLSCHSGPAGVAVDRQARQLQETLTTEGVVHCSHDLPPRLALRSAEKIRAREEPRPTEVMTSLALTEFRLEISGVGFSLVRKEKCRPNLACRRIKDQAVISCASNLEAPNSTRQRRCSEGECNYRAEG